MGSKPPYFISLVISYCVKKIYLSLKQSYDAHVVSCTNATYNKPYTQHNHLQLHQLIDLTTISSITSPIDRFNF